MLFALRAGLVAGAICLAALVGFSLLAGRATDLGLRDLEIGRLRFLVSTLRATVEANLNLGLPIEDLPALQATIERARNAEGSIRAIEIVGPKGTALYSTDRGAIGETIPEAWQEAIEERHTAIWLADDRGEVAIGETLVNDFDLPAGHVVLVVGRDQVRPPAETMLGLAVLGWKAVVAATLAAFVLSFLLAGLRRRQVRQAAGVWRRAWDPAEAESALAGRARKLPSLYGASLRARRTTEEARREVESAQRRLTELDNAG